MEEQVYRKEAFTCSSMNSLSLQELLVRTDSNRTTRGRRVGFSSRSSPLVGSGHPIIERDSGPRRDVCARLGGGGNPLRSALLEPPFWYCDVLERLTC